MCTNVQLSQLVQLANRADSQVAQVVVSYVRENSTKVEIGQSRQVLDDQLAASISDSKIVCITHCLPTLSCWRLGYRISSCKRFIMFQRMVLNTAQVLAAGSSE